METGKGYLVFTLQFHFFGTCAGSDGEFIQLENCHMIFNLGNVTEALKTGKASEMEFVGRWKVKSEMITGGTECPIYDQKRDDAPSRNGKRHAGSDRVRA